MTIDWPNISYIAARIAILSLPAGHAWVGCKLLYRKRNFVQSSAGAVLAALLIAVAIMGGALVLMLAMGREPNFEAARRSQIRIALELTVVATQLIGFVIATRKPWFNVVGYPFSSASRLFAIAAAQSGGSVDGSAIRLANTDAVVRLKYVGRTPIPAYVVESDPGNTVAATFGVAVEKATDELRRPIQVGLAWFWICMTLWMAAGYLLLLFQPPNH